MQKPCLWFSRNSTVLILHRSQRFAKFIFVFAKLNITFATEERQFANCPSSPSEKISSTTRNSPSCPPSGLHPIVTIILRYVFNMKRMFPKAFSCYQYPIFVSKIHVSKWNSERIHFEITIFFIQIHHRSTISRMSFESSIFLSVLTKSLISACNIFYRREHSNDTEIVKIHRDLEWFTL